MIIPSGESRNGWKAFISLTNFYKLEAKSSMYEDHPPTYKDAILNGKTEHTSIHKGKEALNTKDPPTTHPIKASIVNTPPTLVSFDTNNVIIIKRRNFHDEWYKILRALQANITTFVPWPHYNQTTLLCTVKMWIK